jgi:hypothetical protein
VLKIYATFKQRIERHLNTRVHIQNTIFFVIYKCAQQARVLDYTRPERLVSDKHSNLLGPFIGYDEKKMLLIADV